MIRIMIKSSHDLVHCLVIVLVVVEELDWDGYGWAELKLKSDSAHPGRKPWLTINHDNHDY